MNTRRESGGMRGGPGRRMGAALAGSLAVGAAVAVVAPLLAGCAGKSPAEAENREVRLTQDGVMKYGPRFSPDGEWIAYAAASGEKSGKVGVYVIPRKGGEPRKISPDTMLAMPIGWSDDNAVFCLSLDGHITYKLGLDGTARALDVTDAVTRTAAISPDGRTALMLKFNQDNRDIGIRQAEGEWKWLAATPSWEEDGVFGPGADDITVVAVPSFQAQTSTISVWSLKNHSSNALPLPEGQKFQPAWSADGNMLAYAFRRQGQCDLWLYDARTARSAPLTDDTEDCVAPSWSPDGEWIAFTRSIKASHIFVGDPKQEGRRQLTEGPDYDSGPSVSPDGQWVAFFRRLASGEERGKIQLCVVPVAGGPVHALDLKGLTFSGKSGDAITWSPDGKELAFQAAEGTGRMDIHRIGRDGEGLARITVEPGDEIEPRWSPDGRFVAYTRVGAGQTRVVVVPASGGLPKVVSQPDVTCEGGLLSPGSERVAYATFLGNGSCELWLAPVAAPERRTRLEQSKQVMWPLRWTDDGREILLMQGQGMNWRLTAYDVESRAQKVIGKSVLLPSGRNHYVELTPEGAAYQKAVYPGGIVAADGQDRSDLYLIRARMPERPSAVYFGEDHFLWGGFVGLAGCF